MSYYDLEVSFADLDFRKIGICIHREDYITRKHNCEQTQLPRMLPLTTIMVHNFHSCHRKLKERWTNVLLWLGSFVCWFRLQNFVGFSRHVKYVVLTALLMETQTFCDVTLYQVMIVMSFRSSMLPPSWGSSSSILHC